MIERIYQFKYTRDKKIRPMNKIKSEKKQNEPGGEVYDEEGIKYHKLTTDMNYQHEYKWTNVIVFVILHTAAFYGSYLILTFKLKLVTLMWGFFLGLASGEGVVLGSHRGYSHNSFKLTAPGQILIIILQTLSGQNNIYWWVRDHRLHHKFVDTDADPYNAKRGFFFSHMGWLMMKKHPLVGEKGKVIDMSDMEANKFIMFQKKYFIPLFLIITVLIPTIVPTYLWNEDVWVAFFTCVACRYVCILHSTWTINSIAHTYGTKPFDKRITAMQSEICDILTFGDGWHNYHHVFPTDHSISEFGYKGGMSTMVLNFLQRIGVAYDLKKPSKSVMYKQATRYGDGTLTKEDFHLN